MSSRRDGRFAGRFEGPAHDDAVEGILLAAEKYDSSDPVNLGSGVEISIADLVHKVAAAAGFTGRIVFDASKPNGQPRRQLDTRRAQERFGFRARTSFDEGLKTTLEWYLRSREMRSSTDTAGLGQSSSV